MGAKSDTRTMPLFPAPPEIESTRQMIMPELLEKMGWVQQREWVGLTEEEYMDILLEYVNILKQNENNGFLCFYNLVEAKLREKNT